MRLYNGFQYIPTAKTIQGQILNTPPERNLYRALENLRLDILSLPERGYRLRTADGDNYAAVFVFREDEGDVALCMEPVGNDKDADTEELDRRADRIISAWLSMDMRRAISGCRELHYLHRNIFGRIGTDLCATPYPNDADTERKTAFVENRQHCQTTTSDGWIIFYN